VDVFYVTTGCGQKLAGDATARVQQHLIHRIGAFQTEVSA
jgi:hypothetical protein